jgi:histidine triad (HIT) family protein
MARDSDCLFCKIVAGEMDANVAYEDDQVFAFHDISPQAPMHILIVPKEHIPTLNDLRAEHEPLVGRLFSIARQLAAGAGCGQSGYRCVFNCMSGAGQSVWHIHLHLLGGRPLRWPPG